MKIVTRRPLVWIFKEREQNVRLGCETWMQVPSQSQSLPAAKGTSTMYKEADVPFADLSACPAFLDENAKSHT